VKENLPEEVKTADTTNKGKDNSTFDSLLSQDTDIQPGNGTEKSGNDGTESEGRKTVTSSLPKLEIEEINKESPEEIESPKSGISDSIIVDPIDTDLFEKPLDYSGRSLVGRCK
jgi:hypothetical protein